METQTKDLVAQASVHIKAGESHVWDALTNPAAVKEYMFGTAVETSWRKGDPIVWKGEWKGKKYEDKGVILQAEPRTLLQYTHYSPLSGEEDIKANYHTVTVLLNAEDDGVSVSLTQDNNHTEEARQHAEKNWKMMLEGLKKYVEDQLAR